MSRHLRRIFVGLLILALAGPAGAQSPAVERALLDQVKAQVAEDGDLDRFVRGEETVGGVLEVQLCDIAADIVPEYAFEPHLTALWVLGSRSSLYRIRLPGLGYEPAAVDRLLRAYEDRGLDRARSNPATVFDQKNERWLTDQVNALAAKVGLPRVDFVANECGGTPSPPRVTFVVTPGDGRAFLIPEFFARVCEARHLNPYDMKSCAGWTEVFDGGSRALYGTYRYASLWPGLAAKTGSLDVDTSTVVRFAR